MIIKPKTRGFICTTAHPLGCAAEVKAQCDYVKQQPKVDGPKKVLVIGASTGYGLASRITATFGAGADTIGVFFERPASGKRTASAGWYNTAAFEKLATEAGHYAASINGDAFSDEIRNETIALMKESFGKADLVVYSLASPRRTDPKNGETYNSVLKTLGAPYHNKSVDPLRGNLLEITIEPASQEEIDHTIAVMGGEDWSLWIEALQKADLLAENVKTVAYSYIGPELTRPMYREGTIGKAKEDLENTAKELTTKLNDLHGEAYISVNKALVTQSSAAIPVVPLYISLLFKVMKEKRIHEGCIEQIYRLFNAALYGDLSGHKDDQGRIRIDDWEMRDDVQAEVAELWESVNADNLQDISDLKGYCDNFYQLFGFENANVDYEQEVDPEVAIPSISE